MNLLVEKITEVRRSNNDLWMKLLSIALEKSPDETKKILADINKNDKKISVLLGVLSADSGT